MTATTESVSAVRPPVRRREAVELDGDRGLPVIVHRSVTGDGCQPRTERPGVAQRVQPLKRDEENVLQQIVHGIEWNPCDEQAVDHRPVALVQLSEGVSIAALGSSDQRLLVADLHRVWRHQSRLTHSQHEVNGRVHRLTEPVPPPGEGLSWPGDAQPGG